MNASAMPLDQRYATTDEVRRAVGELTASDRAKLARVARLRAQSTSGVDWQDLLQEAVRRSLAGTRRWPREVPLINFLAFVMRSLASEGARKLAMEAADSLSDPEEALAAIASDGPNPEEVAIERDLMARLTELFAEDREALIILSGLKRGSTATEIQLAAGLDQVRYESTRRRIRRKLAQSKLASEE